VLKGLFLQPGNTTAMSSPNYVRPLRDTIFSFENTQQNIYKNSKIDIDGKDGRLEGVLHGLTDELNTVVRNYHIPGYGFCIRCVKDQ